MNISARTGLDPASSTWWDFGEVPNFEANVRRPNPSATGPMLGIRRVRMKRIRTSMMKISIMRVSGMRTRTMNRTMTTMRHEAFEL